QFVAGAVVLHHAGGRTDVYLPDQHAFARIAVHHAADAAQHFMAVGVVVEARQGLAGQTARVVGEVGILAGAVGDVDAETVDAAFQPEAQHAVHGLHDLGVAPVQVGLLGQEQVQIVSAGGLVPGPGAARAQRRAPVVRFIAPDIPVEIGRAHV